MAMVLRLAALLPCHGMRIVEATNRSPFGP